MKGKWFVTKNFLMGYIVTRVKDTSDIMHSGNLEFYGGYSDNKEERQKVADRLNKEGV